jgi:hypothetical protein
MLSTFTITLLGATSRLLRGTNGLLRAAVAVSVETCGTVVDALMRRHQGLCSQYPSLQPGYLVAVAHGSESERRHSLRPASFASLFTGVLASDRQGEGKSSNILGWSSLNLKLDIDNWSGRTRESIPSLT